MQGLLTKEDARQFLGLKTIEATEKLLHRLGVPRMDFSILGGKGIRYRKTDLQDALEKIEVKPRVAKSRPRHSRTDLFDLPIKEQASILTTGGPHQ